MKAAQQVMAQGSCHEFLPDATHHKIAAKIYSRLSVSYKIYSTISSRALRQPTDGGVNVMDKRKLANGHRMDPKQTDIKFPPPNQKWTTKGL